MYEINLVITNVQIIFKRHLTLIFKINLTVAFVTKYNPS